MPGAMLWIARTYWVCVTLDLSDASRHAAGDMQPAATVQPAPTIGVGQHMWSAGSAPSGTPGP